MQDGIHEVAGSVAGEATAGAIGSMSTRGEAENKDSGPWIAEAGNGASPVDLVLIGAPSGLPDAPAVVAQAGAALAGDDGLVYLLEERRDLCAYWCHCIS